MCNVTNNFIAFRHASLIALLIIINKDSGM